MAVRGAVGFTHPGDAGTDDFPVGDCPCCSRVVLAHLWFEDDRSESHRCVHCDAVLPPVRWVTERELGGLGYVSIAEDGGCGRLGCGGGRCGTG